MRLTVAAAVSCLLLTGLCVAQHVAAAIRQETSIPPQSLDTALQSFAQDRNLQLVYATDDVEHLRSSGASGNLTANDALKQLLRGTGLVHQFLDDHTVTVAPRLPASVTSSHSPAYVTQQTKSAGSGGAEGGSENSQTPDLWERFRLSQTGTSFSSASPGAGESARRADEDRVTLAEIIVTAQKKSERLQDVPLAVTGIEAGTLIENNQVRLQDYFTTVPGLSLNAATNGNAGGQSLAIRGITTGPGNPTVGIMIDDVPFGSSSQLTNGELYVPDLDPNSLDHIEVLRGPQGTLYGASSIGGLVKFVTADPVTDRVSGAVQVLGNDVLDGGPGYSVRGAINIPLSDTLAVRASGFTRRDPGYVENVTTGKRDVNEADFYGGMASALWRPNERFSVKLNALFQNSKSDGTPFVDSDGALRPTLGDLKQAVTRGSGGYSLNVRLFSATLSGRIADIDIVSISGYGENTYRANSDNSAYYGSPDSGLGSVGLATIKTDKFSQEFRVSAKIGHSIDWLLGVFYTHENSPADVNNIAVDSVTGARGDTQEDFNYPSSLTEYAGFADVTTHLTDRFDIQLGGRESWNRQIYNETDSGPLTEAFYGVPSPFVNETERTRANAFTYLVTPKFTISSDLMAYTRFASGYRVGGPNFNAVAEQIPINYAPDKTKDYELGIKGALLDRALSFDAALYYIDWRNIQLSLFASNGIPYIGNGGAAKSQGVELSFRAHPVTGLTLSGEATFSDAVLRQDLPASSTAYGLAGDRLPYSSRFTANIAAERDVPLTAEFTGFIGASAAYLGARNAEFTGSPSQPRLVFPSYADVDLRTGVRHASWTISLFGNNLFNKRGIVGGGTNANGISPYQTVYIQPLTVGLNASWTF